MTPGGAYLDFAATTPLAPEVVTAMRECLGPGNLAANPASAHAAGRRSAAAVNRAREEVAGLLGARPDAVSWTSGATESINLAVQGAAHARAHRGKHLITMTTEHKAAVETFKALERQGFEVTWLMPGPAGLVQLDELADAIRADTQLVSIMHVNNETGLIQDVARIGALCRESEVLFHTDAAQSVGKLGIDLNALPVDLMSLSAHKFYGPQGVGALYVAPRTGGTIAPLLFGGDTGNRIRPGTLPVPLIVGMGRAAAVAQRSIPHDALNMAALNERLWCGLQSIDGVIRNGAPSDCYLGLLNVSVRDVEGESLMLGMEPVSVARGSACNASSGESSHVLRALGRSDRLAQASVRFSFGRTTTTAEVDLALERYSRTVAHLRAISPPARRAT